MFYSSFDFSSFAHVYNNSKDMRPKLYQYLIYQIDISLNDKFLIQFFVCIFLVKMILILSSENVGK